jgi:transposase
METPTMETPTMETPTMETPTMETPTMETPTQDPVVVVHPACCGIDVHKRAVQACVLVSDQAGRAQAEVRTFATTTADLLALLDWLLAAGCTHVAMESTGVYWKPLYNLLEGHLQVLVVNAQHIKAVPGRKTDVGDATWIAGLLRHGLLRPSFIPARPQRELRDLTRTRISLVQERAAAVNRLQKTLEGANIKLASVVSDVTGVSAHEMLSRLVAGETDPQVLAHCARGTMQHKIPQLVQALTGRFGAHERFLVAHHLALIDFLDAEIAQMDAEVAQRLGPFEAEIARLDTIPGVNRRTAEVLLAEIGADLHRFPTAGHLAAWAGLAPGNNMSGGKRRGGKTRKGSRWLRAALVNAAHGAAKKKGSMLAQEYTRLAARRGKRRAAVAVAHSILVIVYHLLTRQEPYREEDPVVLDAHRRLRAQQRALDQLKTLGFEVTLTPTTPAA